jgi:glycosyltransferase involved in cell wall biosynthesis
VSKLRLSVFNTQPPHLYFGGVERRIIETAKCLSGEVQTTVYSGTKAGFRRPTNRNGTVIVPCFSTDALYPLDNWSFNRTIAGTVNSGGSDAFEAHAVSGYGFLRMLRKQHIRKPFIQTVHGVLADEYFQALRIGHLSIRGKLANLAMWHLSRLEGECARNADIVVTISRYSQNKLVEYYDVDESKVRIAPNGVDPERFKPIENKTTLRKRLGVEDKPLVLFVGRLIPRKGLKYLVEAAKSVIKEISGATFTIVGDGPLRKKLIHDIAEAGLSKNFVLLGDISEAILPEIYNCADVFVLPSIQEGQGISLLEAQSSEKPVIAFATGGVEEAMQDRVTGILTKPDSAVLAEAILRLLSDRPLRENMGRRGREFVLGNLSWDACARKMLTVYKEAQTLF